MSANVGTDKLWSRNRQRKIKGLRALLPGNDDVGIFDAGIEDAKHKPGRFRVSREDACYLVPQKELVARSIGCHEIDKQPRRVNSNPGP